MLSNNNTNTVLSGLIKSSERAKQYDSNPDNASLEEEEEDENEIIGQNQNNIDQSDEEGGNEANESDDFMDFNALNANNFSDQEEDADPDAEAQAQQNESFHNQKDLGEDHENDSDGPVTAYQGRDSLPNNNNNMDNNNNTEADDANQIRNLTNNSREEEKEKTQKSHTIKTNTNRSLDKNNVLTNRQANNKNNNNNNNNNKEEDEKDEAKKQDILNLLLNTEIKQKTDQKREESAERRQKTITANQNKAKRYQHVESKYKKEKLENDPIYKAGPEKFFINADFENPEFKADNQNAQRKLMLSTKNPSESEKDKLIRKLLCQDIEKQKKITDFNKVTNNDIKNKVSYYLNKKQKNLEEIESLKDENIMKYCTFRPEFVSEKLFPEKRDFKVFLEDQKNHLKRVQDKVEKIKEDDEKKLEQELKPLEKINHELFNPMLNSGEAAEKSRNKSDEKAYLRLYNMRNQKEKNNLLKTEILNNNNVNINNKYNKSNAGKAPKRKTIGERDRYLQNLYKEGLNFIEKVENETTNTQKQLNIQTRCSSNPAWIQNNKFFLVKVMQIFRSNAMKREFQPQDANLYELDEENKFKEEEVINERSSFNKLELKMFLFDFGFALFDFSQLENIKENNVLTGNENANEGNEVYKNKDNQSRIKREKRALEGKKDKVDLKSEEAKLVNLFVDAVFEASEVDGHISSNNLFLYVVGTLNLYDYFIYSSYKKTNPILNKEKEKVKANSNNNDINKIKKPKLPKTEEEMALKSKIIQEIKEEIKKKAQKHDRYASFDAENNLIITDENAQNLKKDFHMFYLNFMFKHNIKKNKDIVKIEVENAFKQINTFKPKIDENSKKLYSDYRRKILTTESNNTSAYGTAKAKTHKINDYIDGLILRKKKKENEKSLLLEQKKKEELKDCTFKPHLEANFISKRSQGESINQHENRLDHLYNLGKQMILNKKDRNKKELEDGEIKFCSFKPDISKPQVKDLINKKISNDIHNEKNYELLYKRLKEGRLERYIKESVHDRGQFPQEINLYKNKNLENISKINHTPNHNNTLNLINITKSFEKPVNTSEGKINTSGFNNSLNHIPSEENEIFNNDPDKKDAIPLLIIDVNIRPGVKKKIYVYDGDTSDALAERFSKEHELDNETKNKLQGLIQSHMSKLLMRIPEENQSVSEKSSTYNLT